MVRKSANKSLTLKKLQEDGILREKSVYMFELGMWLKSIESYFRLEGNRLFHSSGYSISQRNFLEEIKIIDSLLLRITRLCVNIIGTEEWNLIKFYEYVDNILLNKEKPRVISRAKDENYQISIQALFDQLITVQPIPPEYRDPSERPPSSQNRVTVPFVGREEEMPRKREGS